MKFFKSYTFDDILIKPYYSCIIPSVTNISTKITNRIVLNSPVVSSAMDFVTENSMAISLAIMGGIGVIHKNMSISRQINEINLVKSYNILNEQLKKATIDLRQNLRVLAAIGAGQSESIRLVKLLKSQTDGIVIDTSHAHSKNVLDTIIDIKKFHKNIDLIVGNIATINAARFLIDIGIKSLKVGVGPGAICTTRIVTGVGIPQISAISQVAEICIKNNIYLIADGGIKCSGDIAKAIATGADAVMLGSLLAGVYESPGKIIKIANNKYKNYRGMGSESAMKSGSANRYFCNMSKTNIIPQGVEGIVKYSGILSKNIKYLIGGLKSSMGYTGNKDIKKMKKNCEFYNITVAGLKESHIHTLSSYKKEKNYN